MFYFIKVIIFLFSVVAALGGIYHLLFFKNENVIVSFMYGVGIMLIFSGLVFLWYQLYRIHKAIKPWDVYLRLIGYIVTAVPAIVYVLIVFQQTWYLIQAKIFISKTVISDYQEEAIEWRGFDSPTGLRITITLDHPISLSGYLRSPKLIMGKKGVNIPKDLDRAYWQFCGEPVVDDSSCLTAPIWPMKPFPELSEDAPTILTFELFPSNLYYIESENKVCLRKRNPYSEVSFVGLDTVALWHFLGNEHKLEMTEILTNTIRKKSTILKDIEFVQKMYRNAESGAFLAAGYQGCEVRKAILFTDETECFCRDSNQDDGIDKANDNSKESKKPKES